MTPHARIGKDLYGKVFAYIELFGRNGFQADTATIEANITTLQGKWNEFLELQSSKPGPGYRTYFDKKTGQPTSRFSAERYFRSHSFEKDLAAYFKTTPPRAV